METETHQPVPAPTPGERPAMGAAVPVWLFVFMALLLYWGALYFDTHGGWFNANVYEPYRTIAEVESYQPRSDEPDPRRGKIWFMLCDSCHGEDGAGKPGQAPPLAGSEWVNAEGVNRLIRIPVTGLIGPIKVKGQEYNFPGGMTAIATSSQRSTVTDEKLSDILTYIRQAWGNKAGPVTVDQVKAIRDEIGDRSTQMTTQELESLPEKK